MLEQFFTEYKKALNSNNDLYNFVKRKSIKESEDKINPETICLGLEKITKKYNKVLNKLKNNESTVFNLRPSGNNSDEFKVIISFDNNDEKNKIDNEFIRSIKSEVDQLLHKLTKKHDELKKLINTGESDPNYTNNICIDLSVILSFYRRVLYNSYYQTLLSIKSLLEFRLKNNGSALENNIKESIAYINGIYKNTEGIYKKLLISTLKTVNKTPENFKKLCDEFINSWQNINDENLDIKTLENAENLFENEKFIKIINKIYNDNNNTIQDEFARESNDEIETLDNDKIKNTNLPTPLIQLKKHGLKYDESALTKRDKIVINIIYNKIHGSRDGVERLTTSGNKKNSYSYFDDENESKSFCSNLKLKRLLEAKPVPRAQGKTTNNVPQAKGNQLSAVPPTASGNRTPAVPTTTSKGLNPQQNTQGNVPSSQRTQTNAVPSAKGRQTSSVPSAKGNQTSAVPTASKSKTQDVARAVGKQTVAPQKTYQDQNNNNNGNNGNNGNVEKLPILKNLRYEINIMSPLARCLIIFLIANEIIPQYQYLSSKNKKLAIKQVTGAKKNVKGKNKTKEGDKEALQQDSLVLQKIDFKDGKGKEYKILYKDDIHKQKAVFVIQPNTSSGSKTEHDIGRCWFKGDVVTDVSEDRDNGFKSNMMKVTHVSSGEHSIYKFVDYYMKNDQIPSKSGGLLDKVRDWALRR